MVDAFDGFGNTPAQLSTEGFYRLCRRHLVEDGSVAVNIMPSDAAFSEKVRILRSSFDHVFFVDIPNEGTIVFLAWAGKEFDRKEMLSRAESLESRCGFQHPFLQHAKRLRPVSELKKAEVLNRRVPVSGPGSPISNRRIGLTVGPFGDVQGFERVGRNAPCPCGSGKKFKKCHGRLGGENLGP